MKELASHANFLKYKSSARVKKLEFSISEDVFCNIVSMDCHYCGSAPVEKMNLYGHKNRHLVVHGLKTGYYSNGIDRINSEIGYIESNCVPCCWKCNQMKMTMRINEFLSKANEIVYHSFANFSLVDMCKSEACLEDFYRKAA